MRLAKRCLVLVLPWELLLAQEPRALVSKEEAARQAELDATLRAERDLETSLSAVRSRRKQIEESAQRRNADDIPELEDDKNRIVNGVATVDYPGVGALVKGQSAATAHAWCTGTLVGCRTFLTANHCVEDDRTPAVYRVYFQNVGFVDVERISLQHREYAFPHADLAVLRLARPVDGLPVSAINRSFPVPARTAGTLIGFGRTGGSLRDAGVKRRGGVQTAACDRSETSLLCWDFQGGMAGIASNTCNADSGGPLFVQDPAAASTHLLAGVTSGGTRRDCLAGDHSYDVDVRQFADWIAGQAGIDLGKEECGPRPLVGTAPVKVLLGSRSLQIGESQDYRFRVAAGVGLMVVALNGTDNPRTNLNFFVKRGTAATASESDCAWNDTSNFGACTFDRPAAGDWFVRVDQQGQDQAEFQLVVTMYP